MHGLNLYDYSARSQDPALGVFTTPDPLAEKHYNWSPYAYVLNNPMRYTDPDGRLEKDKNGNVKFHSTGNVSKQSVNYNGYSYTPNYESGYVKTDEGNKVSADKFVSVTVSKDGESLGNFTNPGMAKVGDYDFSSNCFGLAMADGQVYINEPETVLKDEYTKVGEGEGTDTKAGVDHNVVTVGLPGYENNPYHAASTSDNGTSYTQKDDNGSVKTDQPLTKVIDYKGTGNVLNFPVKDFKVIYYEKNSKN